MKIDVPKEIKNKENRAGVVAIYLAYFVARTKSCLPTSTHKCNSN